DAVPPEAVAADASLSAARVWTALDMGRLEEAGAALDAAEASGQPDAHLAVLRALHMYKSGDVGAARRRLGEIPPQAPWSDDPFVATVHRVVEGISWMWLGDFARARELLIEAARRAEADGNRLGYIYAQGCRALLAVSRGDLPLADTLVLDAEAVIERTLSDLHFVAMFPRPGPAAGSSRGSGRRPYVRRRRRWTPAAAAPGRWNSPRRCSPPRRRAEPAHLPSPVAVPTRLRSRPAPVVIPVPFSRRPAASCGTAPTLGRSWRAGFPPNNRPSRYQRGPTGRST